MRPILHAVVRHLERYMIYILGLVFGISLVVRYLRNPDPRNVDKLLTAFGATIKEKTTFKGGIIIDNAIGDMNSTDDFSNLNIGRNCYVGKDVYFDLANQIRIEDNVVLSGRVGLITHADCNRSNYLEAKYPRVCEPVFIREGSWIGFGATVLHGVEVGPNTMVAAGCVQISNARPNALYAGVPGQLVKRLDYD